MRYFTQKNTCESPDGERGKVRGWPKSLGSSREHTVNINFHGILKVVEMFHSRSASQSCTASLAQNVCSVSSKHKRPYFNTDQHWVNDKTLQWHFLRVKKFTQIFEIHSEGTGWICKATPHLQPKSDYNAWWAPGPDLSFLINGHASTTSRYNQGPKMNSLIDLCGRVWAGRVIISHSYKKRSKCVIIEAHCRSAAVCSNSLITCVSQSVYAHKCVCVCASVRA